jgi:GAF domain-containing protein
MLEVIHKIYDLSNYKSKLEQQTALFVYGTLTLMLSLVSIYIFLIPAAGVDGQLTVLQDAINGDGISVISVLFFYSFLPFIYYATRRGNLTTGGIGIGILWYVLAFVPVILGSRNMVDPLTTAELHLLIILCGFVLHKRGVVGAAIVAIFTLSFNFAPEFINQVPVIVIELLGTSIVIYMYIRYARISQIEGAELATKERVKLAEIIIQISSLTLNRLSVTEVLKQGLDLIQRGYPQFYHAQVFLLDDAKRNAQLVSSTGEAGRELIQRRHSIGVGSQSVVGQATLRNTHIIGRTTDTDTIHKQNEFLPDTIVETAFPLRVGDQVIGALDLQSQLNLALPDDDIFTYQSLTNSFALAIDNVRQFESAESRIQENQELAVQARQALQQALQEVDRLNKRLMEQAWSEYLMTKNENMGLNVDFESNIVEENHTWSTSLTQAMEDGNLIQSVDDNQQLIAIPLKVRGQVIGAIEFELGEDENIDPNDLNLIQEVSERFGLAAENTRLVEESQRIAQREALINEIGTRLQATNNIESTLTEAVRSLNNVLSANRVSIKLREPDTTT